MSLLKGPPSLTPERRESGREEGTGGAGSCYAQVGYGGDFGGQCQDGS
jgi:hypothetical protein